MPEQTAAAEEASLTVHVAGEIRAWMARRRMSQRALAAEVGMSAGSLHPRIHGTQELGVNEVEKIAKALDVTVLELMAPAHAPVGAA